MNLRGRLENSGLPMYRSRIASMAGCGSIFSSAAMPATGEPRITRGVSPQASVVSRPTPSSFCQIAGMSSISIQWYWMFCRSVTSAVSRAWSREISPTSAQLLGGQRAAVDAHPQHEVAVVELLGLQRRGAAAVDPGPALGVEAPPAHPAAQVGRVDGVEAALGVDVLDAGPDVEPVVVLLGALVRVQRLAVAELPLALAALALGWASVRVVGGKWGASGSGRRDGAGGDLRERCWAGDGAQPTERAAHPVQVDVAAGHEPAA